MVIDQERNRIRTMVQDFQNNILIATTLENGNNFLSHDGYFSLTGDQFSLELFKPNSSDSELTDVKELEIITSNKKLVFIVININKNDVFDNDANKMAVNILSFINNFITAYEHFHLTFGTSRFKLDGRKIFWQEENINEWKEIEYEQIKLDLSKYFLEYSMDGSESMSCGSVNKLDIVALLTSNPDQIDLSWSLLVDAINHCMEMKFRETIICCCSAIEIKLTPLFEKWLLENTVTGSKSHIKDASHKMSNPLIIEIFMKSVMPEAFQIYTEFERKQILHGLKQINSTRNKIVHKGYLPNLTESKSAIINTVKLLRSVFIIMYP